MIATAFRWAAAVALVAGAAQAAYTFLPGLMVGWLYSYFLGVPFLLGGSGALIFLAVPAARNAESIVSVPIWRNALSVLVVGGLSVWVGVRFHSNHVPGRTAILRPANASASIEVFENIEEALAQVGDKPPSAAAALRAPASFILPAGTSAHVTGMRMISSRLTDDMFFVRPLAGDYAGRGGWVLERDFH